MEINQNIGTVENLAAHCKWNWERLFLKENEPSLDLFNELADWLFFKGIMSFQKIQDAWFWVFIDEEYKKFSIPNKLEVFLPLLNRI